MASRRRRGPGRFILLLLLVAAAGTATWWFLLRPVEGTEAPAPTTREPEVEVIEMVETEPARPASIDPVTGDPRRSLGDRGRDIPPIAAPTTPEPVISEPVASEPDTLEPKGTEVAEAPLEFEPDPVPEVEPEPSEAPSIADAIGASLRASNELSEAIALEEDDPLEARRLMSSAWAGGLSDEDRATAAAMSRRLAERTLLNARALRRSPWTSTYVIQPSDTLGGIMNDRDTATSLRFVSLINGLSDPNAIRAGDTIVLPAGRFHVVVDVGARDLAVFQELEEGRRELLMVVPVALGPQFRRDVDDVAGLYRVRPRGMRRNPSWTNPSTGRRWNRGDAGNPVGEHWISLAPWSDESGEDPLLAIHGTDPSNPIAQGDHPGSIAVDPADAELLLLMLDTGDSIVDIRR